MRILLAAGGAAVGVQDGYFTAPRGEFDVVLEVPGGELRPGLINAHDHLHRNHYGRLGHPPYANAYEWGRDIHDRCRDAIAAGRARPRREALLEGAWKNLFAGVTTVVHHDPWEPDFDIDFPIRVAAIRCAHSLGFDDSVSGRGGPFAIHLAEGVDTASADEVRQLERLGCLSSNVLAVHVVGVDAEGIHLLRASGAAIVWCPTSNHFLFGSTAPAELLAHGVDVLLGTDSLLTGAGTLLDELRTARELSLISEQRLLDAVGATAARRLHLPLPSLEPGAPADVIVLRRPLLEATLHDVAVVMVRGELRVLDPALVRSIGRWASAGRYHSSAGVLRWVCDASAYHSGSRSASAPSSTRPIPRLL